MKVYVNKYYHMKCIKTKVITTIIFLSLVLVLFFGNKLVESKNIKIQEKEITTNLLLSHFWDHDFLLKEKFELDIDNINVLNSLAGHTNIGLWIEEKHCGPCIDFCFEEINSLPDSIKSNIVVFLDYENPRIRRVQKEKINDPIIVLVIQLTLTLISLSPLLLLLLTQI